MTGYHISIGYNSALNATERREAFETLKQVVASLRAPSLIVGRGATRRPAIQP